MEKFKGLSKKYRTKTMNISKNYPRLQEYWGIAIDYGYSAVKGMCANKVFSFPGYARLLNAGNQQIGDIDSSNILYKNEDGEDWIVGAPAQRMIPINSTEDSESVLYDRNRYFDPMFKVLIRVGLALGLMDNNCGSYAGQPIVVQTGLPSQYADDASLLREVMSGHHKFSVKIGTNSWQNFNFTLDAENIGIMPQPMGTFRSIITDNNGRRVPDALKYFKSNILIFDPGFGTFDTFEIQNGTYSRKNSETFKDLGMNAVLSLLSDKIFSNYATRIPVSAMQKYLEIGTFPCYNRRERKSSSVEFDDLLHECSEAICLKALEKIQTIYNDLIEINYLVVTGGTGAAWFPTISDYFSGLETLTILEGNQNDPSLPYIFANVRGYYMELLSTLKAKVKKEREVLR